MQWYYLDAQRQQLQADEATLKNFLQEGKIKSDTLVWNETMTEWTAIEKALPAVVGGTAAASAAVSGTPAPTASQPSSPTAASATPQASSPLATTGGGDAAASVPSQSLNPYSAPASATSPGAATGSGNIRQFAAILAENAGWAKLLGVVFMIAGIIYCLTIIGAVVGWVPIWLGLILMRVARLAKDAEASGSPHSFTECLESIGRYFKIMGILTLIGIVINVIAMVFYIIAFAAAAASGEFGSM